MDTQIQTGLNGQVGTRTDGAPIFLFIDPKTRMPRYVVRLPDGQLAPCDGEGKLIRRSADQIQPVPAAVMGGMLGAFLGGPVGALIGGTLLFALATLDEKNNAS